MENYSYSSYPDSVNSSPRSREIDVENASWDEPPTSNYKIKLLCSYGGKIQPRPHDNQLTYVGGDTKILAVDRNIKFSNFIMKLSSLCDCEITFKYQLPGEDLDALISVTNDEDLEHMMLEYDRLHKSSAKPARLRLFLFSLKPALGNNSSFGSTESKSERQWFVDALNSVNLEAAPPPSSDEPSQPPPAAAVANNPDYLFGLDKAHAPHAPPDVEVKVQSHAAAQPVNEGLEGREMVGGEPTVTPAEIHRQIEELQRMQISGQEQSPRFYGGEYNSNVPYQQSVTPPPQTSIPVGAPTAAYWPDRHMATGTYSGSQNEPPVYIIQTPAGVYQAPPVRQVTGQVGQGYYGMQRMVPEVYREQPVYNSVPQQPKYTGAYNSEAVGMMRAPPEAAYAQIGYDGAGRQVYYTAPGGVVAAPPYQAVSAAGAAAGYIPEGKVVTKVSQTSSM